MPLNSSCQELKVWIVCIVVFGCCWHEDIFLMETVYEMCNLSFNLCCISSVIQPAERNKYIASNNNNNKKSWCNRHQGAWRAWVETVQVPSAGHRHVCGQRQTLAPLYFPKSEFTEAEQKQSREKTVRSWKNLFVCDWMLTFFCVFSDCWDHDASLKSHFLKIKVWNDWPAAGWSSVITAAYKWLLYNSCFHLFPGFVLSYTNLLLAVTQSSQLNLSKESKYFPECLL